ncbi:MULTISPECIES: hypothetical protein [Halorussus]|uniref:hypothetical protein n=1 Tax=Halorussus TaxID=1070314 RepID=UPI00209D873E|nr:hypothetical protein [Halorussus vallis]USZ76614.1 hypothetical protein NGM07_04625 [Halorussus vallis]
MGELLRRLVFGRETNRRRRWKLFVGGYAAVVAAFFALVLVARAVGAGDLANVLYYRAFPLALFYAPTLVAAVAAFRGGGLLLCLGIGLAPVAVVGVTFVAVDLAAWLRGAVPPGDAPAWALVLAYAVACLTSAVAGFVAGTVARLTMRTVADRR